MNVRERMKGELERRVKVLGEELTRWEAVTSNNVGGFGIHKNQIQAVRVMIDGLDEKQRIKVGTLDPASPVDFAEKYLECVEDMTALQNVWDIFQEALLQRGDQQRQQRLDAADLIAADCYRECINTAVSWGALVKDEKRPPPLVVIESRPSAGALGRGEEIGLLGHPLQRYREIKLTVPLVLLPADHLESMWLLCVIFHEVGHSLDQDLGLEADLKGRVNELIDAGHIRNDSMWWDWTSEVLADVFAVLYGGGAFVGALGNMVNVVAPAKRYETLAKTDRHPNPFVRAPLLCSMVKRLNVPSWTKTSDAVMADWMALARPAWVEEYVKEIDAIVDAFVDAKLQALKGHSLRDLVPTPFEAQLGALRGHFLAGLQAPTQADGIGYRHIPAGAQLAFAQSDLALQTLAAIHDRALAFLHALVRPDFLGGLEPEQKAHLKDLTAKIDLRKGR